MNTGLTAGFSDPVRDAQRCFRSVLDAMSRPGRIATVRGVVPPAPLCVASAAVMLTLVDHETAFWLDPDASAAAEWLAFHCGAPLVEAQTAAVFALSMGGHDLLAFNPGSHEGPELSATAIVQLPCLSGGRALRLSGPGLRDSVVIAPSGLPAEFPAIWRRNRGLFPAGIDLILCAGDTLAALPRTVLVEEA